MMDTRELTILVVDDEPQLRSILSEICLAVGRTIYCASDGIEALEFLHRQSVDLVLSDLTMPRMGGYDLLLQMRKEGILSPFHIISAYCDRVNIQKAIEMGAAGFIEKPFSYSDIENAIRGALIGKYLMSKVAA